MKTGSNITVPLPETTMKETTSVHTSTAEGPATSEEKQQQREQGRGRDERWEETGRMFDDETKERREEKLRKRDERKKKREEEAVRVWGDLA